MAAPAYATPDAVKRAVADMVKVPADSMADYWLGHCARAAQWAKREVQNRLLRRGFTAAQIADWPMLDDVSLDLGTWKAMILGGMYSDYAEAVDALDVREELDHALVWDSARQEWVQPGEGTAGNTASGGRSVTQDAGVFNWDDSEDGSGGLGNRGIWW